MNTRQVRTFAANNSYLQEYYDSRERTYPRGIINSPYGKVHVSTYRLNVHYHYAWDTMARKFPAVFTAFGGTGFHINHIFTFIIDREAFDLDFHITGLLNWNGSYRIHIKPNNKNAQFFGRYDQHHMEGMEWSKEGLIAKVEKIIRSRLLGTGFFARVQLYYGIPKEQLPEKIKMLYKAEKNCGVEINQLHKWIRRNFNIDGSDIWDEKKLVEAVNTHGRQPRLVRLAYYDASWFNDFEGDLDELEEEFYKHIEKDTIYL